MSDYDELPDEDEFGDGESEDLAIKIHECTYEHDYQCCGEAECDITATSKHSPIIEINKGLIDAQTMGYEVAQIRVLHGDKYVNFWVCVGTNNQGRVFCETSTNVADKSVRKKVQAGAWRQN